MSELRDYREAYRAVLQALAEKVTRWKTEPAHITVGSLAPDIPLALLGIVPLVEQWSLALDEVAA